MTSKKYMLSKATEFVKKITPYAHSAFLIFQDGEVVGKSEGRECLSAITYREIPADGVIIFFGKSVVEENPSGRDWIDYVINRSNYSDAFITKDVDEGLSKGFWVNVDAPRYIVVAGLLAIRHKYEFQGNWTWKEFVDMGYSEIQAYALATRYACKDGVLKTAFGNANHLVQGRDYNLASFTTIPEPEEAMTTTIKKGLYNDHHEGISSCWCRGIVHVDHIELTTKTKVMKNSFGESTVTRYTNTKKNLDEILRQIS